MGAGAGAAVIGGVSCGGDGAGARGNASARAARFGGRQFRGVRACYRVILGTFGLIERVSGMGECLEDSHARILKSRIMSEMTSFPRFRTCPVRNQMSPHMPSNRLPHLPALPAPRCRRAHRGVRDREPLSPGHLQGAKIIAATPGDTPSSSGATLRTVSLALRTHRHADRRRRRRHSRGHPVRDERCFSWRTVPSIRDDDQRMHRIVCTCRGRVVENERRRRTGARSADFARRYPGVRLDADRIYTRDGKYWTSGGVSAGIDLALALIEEDLGEATARRVAQQLVVYHRRPGGQSQFSALLEMENPQGRFASLLEYMRAHLTQKLDVDSLAARMCMSARHFSREFQRETGLTPAKAVERLRADAARAALESGKSRCRKSRDYRVSRTPSGCVGPSRGYSAAHRRP